jgi:Fe-S-cluster formation regulator IscX/YfhJ
MSTTVNVSDEFLKVYRNFNVISVEEDAKKLDKKELYLLLTLCLDKFEDTDPVVVKNFQPFKDEVMEIFKIQDDMETENPLLLELIKITEDKYIDTEVLKTKGGEEIPEPLTKDEVRDEKIKIIGLGDLN